MKNDAFDCLVKVDDNNKIIPLLNRVIEKVELKKKTILLQKQVGEKFGFESIIGSSPSITAAVEIAKKWRQHKPPFYYLAKPEPVRKFLIQ